MYANALFNQNQNQEITHFETKFTDTELQLLKEHGILRTFSRKAFIYYERTSTHSIFLLEEGLVKTGSFINYNQEFIKSVIYPNQLFGALGLIGEQTHGNFARCLSKQVKVYSLRIEDLKYLMSKDNILSQKIMAQVGQQLYKVEQKIEAFICKSARERIVSLLKELAQEIGTSVENEILIESIFPQQDIGIITGISRQTVSKIFTDLKKSNQIYVDRKNIFIRDINTLA